MSTLPQKLTLVSHLVKAHVERADKDKDNMVTIEEILAFDDFEFLDTEYLAVSELACPWISIKYLVYLPRFIKEVVQKNGYLSVRLGGRGFSPPGIYSKQM